MAHEAAVQDNSAAQRFEWRDGDQLAFLQYRKPASGPIVLVHTEVPPAMEGRGVGGRLVKAALDAARAAGRRVIPRCPFARSYIERHPEYASLIEPPA